MEGLALETVLLVVALVLLGLAASLTLVAVHLRRRRTFERAAGVRRKEKIHL